MQESSPLGTNESLPLSLIHIVIKAVVPKLFDRESKLEMQPFETFQYCIVCHLEMKDVLIAVLPHVVTLYSKDWEPIPFCGLSTFTHSFYFALVICRSKSFHL